MATLLKQSTTVTIRLGPCVDKTDGVTAETALAGTMVVEVSKNHGAFAARNSATAIAHDAQGWYSVELNTTDTGTLGPFIVKTDDDATYLPVWREFLIVPANVYESLVTGVEFLETTGLKADFSISGTTVTVKKQDGSTTQYTKTLTATAGADPITALD